ncbi:MAG: PIG-L family deacetylase [Bacteroidetes bacterium]|nr:MAG: PIG-L family deacetylase [Bacteroidota bacterium]
MKRFVTLALGMLTVFGVSGQLPNTYTSSQLLQQLKRLKVLGSVLYVAAHPDDENTRLIAYLANQKLYRTGYLSLTRGDGGQNLIGDEQAVELGLIRTQELMAARRIDGGEQFFSRAYDFGYSKSTDEALTIWNSEAVLADVVWVIRRFQPDAIIARFPEDSRAGHGHHSASGLMARLGYAAAADPNQFADQIPAGAQVWQAKRLLWNTFNFGTTNTTDSTQFKLEVGQYLPLLGKSLGELSGESRSQHKSQGFGVSRQRGTATEFFTTLSGTTPANDLLDGVNTTWSRIPGGQGIEADIDAIIAAFDHNNTAGSVPALQALQRKLWMMSGGGTWLALKRSHLQQLILACAGVYAEATVSTATVIASDSIAIRVSAINRSSLPFEVKNLAFDAVSRPLQVKPASNALWQTELRATAPTQIMETQPYWLRQSQGTGLFTVGNQQDIGLAENEPLKVNLTVELNDAAYTLAVPIRYRYVDPVKAEQYQPVYVSNPFLITNDPGILLFRKNSSDSATIEVNITAPKATTASRAAITITSDSSRYSRRQAQPPMQWNSAGTKSVSFRLPNYLKGSNKDIDFLQVAFEVGDSGKPQSYFNAMRTIAYDHIPTQSYHYQDKIKVLHLDLKGGAKKVGYIPGAGDKVLPALVQMGYQVTELNPNNLELAYLRQFDAIITGVRAYNVHEGLSNAYDALMAFVSAGGNLIVQYNTNSNVGPVKAKMAPYPVAIGRTRITNELASPQFLLPKHPVFNYPNTITPKDFDGWIQERSIYHAEGFDASKFAAPLAFADPGEAPQSGSLVIAPYGKGNFVYTGLVFFRELPAGVPGAYRLMANLIELPKH